MIKRQCGFTVVEALLLLIIAGLIGFIGWYVWSTNSATNKSLRNADKVNQITLPNTRSIDTYDKCKQAGGRIQESYPEVCVYGDKSFTNPNQRL